MKKNLLFGLLLLLGSITACKKENKSQTFTGLEGKAVTSKQSFVEQPTYYYVDLELQPRQPGQNYDTYQAYYGYAMVTVTGSPSWDLNAYPNLVNGVPTVGAGIGAAAGYNASIGTGPSSGEYDAFTVTVGTISNTDFSKFLTDLSYYRRAFDTYTDNPSIVKKPKTEDFIKASYSTNPGFINTTGKLIRVTTGTHWAIATVNYPLPTNITPPVHGHIAMGVSDNDRSPYTYYLHGSDGKLTIADVGINRDYSNSYTVKVSGTYNLVSSGVYHYQGTVYRSDGTFYYFDETEELG